MANGDATEVLAALDMPTEILLVTMKYDDTVCFLFQPCSSMTGSTMTHTSLTKSRKLPKNKYIYNSNILITKLIHSDMNWYQVLCLNGKVKYSAKTGFV